ncbi:N-acetylglucosamine kinase [Hoeflea sp. WL0058]|uniref:N-acetylglucosamine kinase n=1 Tax=Flavimaribacter sediminis TaxID=2865987 RepID=A0AAE2ZSK1_9HYPH|nr:BadF/BadG/BcrA/BcrD ATPase family protein [Flavimaribacter sediminis]MBW8640167.1 N-acetylglucosamine kinase [Flavimaribacter sediminis]
MTLILAVDGGGTSCRAAVADHGGAILGRAVSGPANVSTDPKGAAENIVIAARAALADAGHGDATLSSLPAFLGLAGANLASAAEAVRGHLPFERCVIEDDAGTALQGALGDMDGAVMVLGTGSVLFGRRNGSIFRAGGWGFAVGDQGSGARIGRELLQETLLAYDKVRAQSPLTTAVLAEYDSDPMRLAEFAQQARPTDFARFAPRVFSAADDGDAVALDILDKTLLQVEAQLQAFLWPECEALCLLGGLAELYTTRIGARFRAIVKPPQTDALVGAVQLAVQEFRTTGQIR